MKYINKLNEVISVLDNKLEAVVQQEIDNLVKG